VKFTEAGAIAIQVDYEDDRLAFRVRDTGIDIALEQQRTLFIPFKQVESDTNRRFGGTGLGLAICHQLTQKMGGSLSLESTPGMGTCVTFTLPLAECQWEAPPLTGQVWWWFGEDEGLESVMARLGARLVRMEAHHWDNRLSIPICCWKPASHCSTSRRASRWGWRGEKLKGRVLVADDHPVNRALLTRQLAILGLESEVVEDGEEALRAWQGQDFALLLTDCHMPVMDGYALTRA